MNLTEKQLDTLRHMLGINDPYARRPVPYRDYFCANPGDEKLLELERIGAVTRYSTHGSYYWYKTTPAGRAAAIASYAKIRVTRSKRVYMKFLEVRDAFNDLTFKDFLTHPDFRDCRRNA